tara:strand:+ start:568 stop:1236 length:669 start_codon:yes stop_codon:yes gene_type:complete
MSDKFLAFTGTVKSEIQIGSKSPKIYHTPIEPTSVIAGSVWINSTTRAIKFRNELNTDWLDLASASSATQEFVNNAIASLEFQELTGFNYFSDPTLTTVTSATWSTGPSSTFSVPAGGGTYFVGYRFNYNCSDSQNAAGWKVQLDSTIDLNEIADNNDGLVLGDYLSTGTALKRGYNDFSILTLAEGTHTIDIQLRAGLAGSKASIWNYSLYIWRINGGAVT